MTTLYVLDVEGARFWNEWNCRRVAVSFTELFNRLESHLGHLFSASHKENLRFVLNDAGCNLLTVYRFGDFLKGFGPGLASAVASMQNALQVRAPPVRWQFSCMNGMFECVDELVGGVGAARVRRRGVVTTGVFVCVGVLPAGVSVPQVVSSSLVDRAPRAAAVQEQLYALCC